MKPWQKVRHIPTSLENLSKSDQLTGTEEYGNVNDNGNAWAVKFDKEKVAKVYVRSNKEDDGHHTHVKEYARDKLSTLFAKDEYLTNKAGMAEKEGASIYVTMVDEPYQIIGVHNGPTCIDIDEEEHLTNCGTMITNHMHGHFIKPAMQQYKEEYDKIILPSYRKLVSNNPLEVD